VKNLVVETSLVMLESSANKNCIFRTSAGWSCWTHSVALL